jgi:hypothetical protein
MKKSQAESLVLHIAQDPNAGLRDGSVMELLEEYFAGAAIQTLIPLLVCEDERVVAEASWIASELSWRIMDIWCDLLRLIDHPSEKVRFWIVLCGQSVGETLGGRDLARIISTIRDSASSVRWQAMVTVAKLSPVSLRGALPHIQDRDIAQIIGTITESYEDPFATVVDKLVSSDWRERTSAVLIAARIAAHDIRALDRARFASDFELATFASDMFQRAQV